MLAHHYLSALDYARAAGQDTSVFTDRARIALREAGDRAWSLNAYAAAARLYKAALELWPAEDAERPLVVLAYGRALWNASEGGAEEIAEARDGLIAGGDVETAAEAELLLAERAWAAGSRDDTSSHLDRAAALVESSEPSRAKAHVVGSLSRFKMLFNENDEAIRLGRETLAMADALGVHELRTMALNNIGVARVVLGDPGGLEDLERSVETGEQVGGMELLRALINLASVHGDLGDLHRSRALHEHALHRAERLGAARWVRWLGAELIFDRYYAGEWDEALRAAEEFIAGATASPHQMEAAARYVRAVICLARGNPAGAVADAEWLLDFGRRVKDPQVLYPALACYARCLAAAGRAGPAEGAADELLDLWRTSPFQAGIWFLDLAFALVALGRSAAVLSFAAELPSETHWARAATAYAAGERELAGDVLLEMGDVADEAYVRLRAAEAFVADGKRAAADVQLQRALAFYRSVGATAYIREGEALLAASA
jgi:tetratricopeptide (TPR) repeat protein